PADRRAGRRHALAQLDAQQRRGVSGFQPGRLSDQYLLGLRSGAASLGGGSRAFLSGLGRGHFHRHVDNGPAHPPLRHAHDLCLRRQPVGGVDDQLRHAQVYYLQRINFGLCSQGGSSMETIGFIGLGTVGGTVAANILGAGHPMVVYDIRAEAMATLRARGAQPAASSAEVARRCRIVFTSLPGPAEIEQAALGSSGLVAGVGGGSLYVDLSSSDPELIRRIAGEFRGRGARAMDAPLIIGKNGLAQKSVQVLACCSERVIYAGSLGNGTAIKLAHNLVRRGIGLAIGEGVVLGAKAGVDAELLWDCMHWGLDAQLHQLRKNFPEIVFQGNYEAPAGFGIGLARKDVGLATELGRRLSVPMPVAALVEQALIQAINRGWGEQ